MKSFVINKNDAGQRLDKFISKAVPSLPYSLIYKSIRTKNIKVNRKRADISYKLNEGDTVDVYVKDEFFTSKSPQYAFKNASKLLDIVYEDQNIMLVNKSAGVLVHEDKNEYSDTLILRIQRYLFEKGEYSPDDENSFAPALANRIDRGTSGIVIAAKNAESLRILNEKIKNRELVKKYLCLVHGAFSKKDGVISAFLQKDCDSNRVYIHSQRQSGDKEIKTGYRVIAQKDGISLLEIELFTGRTHQIRAQMAYIGHPLVGDGKYGKNTDDKKLGFKHQALCSYFLKFDFISDAGILNYLNQKTFKLKSIWFADEFLSDFN